MKILIICFEFRRENINKQPWSYIYRISKELISLENDVVILSNASPELLAEEETAGIKIKRIKKLISKECLKIIISEKPDILIILQGLSSFLNAHFLKEIKKLKIPSLGILTSPIYKLKDFFTLNFRDFILNFNYLPIHLVNTFIPRRIVKNGVNKLNSKTIVLSNHLKDRLLQFGVKKEKIEVLPPGVDEQFLSFSSFNNRIFETKFNILYFGLPITLRGTDILIKAFSKVKIKIPHCKLLMLLRIDEERLERERRYLIKLINSLKLEDSVEIVSKILTPEEIKKFIYQSEIVVLPFKLVISDVPLVILESMVLGKPVISTNVNGIYEFLRDNRGVIIKPNTEELSKAIITLLLNPNLRDEIGKKAQNYIASYSSWKDIGIKFFNIAKELANYKMLSKHKVIAFCGPDGAGKTELIKLLNNYFIKYGFETKYIWMRFNHYITKITFALCRFSGYTVIIKNNNKIVFKYHKFYEIPMLGRIYVISQIIDTLFSYICKIWLQTKIQKKIVLCDRYIPDILVDIMVETGWENFLSSWSGKILLKFIRSWIKCLTIIAGEETLKKRRFQANFDPHFSLRLKYYKKISDELKIPIVNNEGEIMESFQQILSSISI